MCGETTRKGLLINLRSAQKPLKDEYRSEPESSRITLIATGSETDAQISCSADIGRAVYAAEAHSGVRGMGTAAYSGDLLLAALAACAQITCQMVASAMNISTNKIQTTAEGDLDLASTLNINKDIPVGFKEVRLILEVDAPEATAEQFVTLHGKTEQYCVVMQTLANPPKLRTEWVRDSEDAR